MHKLIFAGLLLSVMTLDARADIRSDTPPRPRPVNQPASEPPPAPQPRPICGAGVGLVVLAAGIWGAWRFAPGRIRTA